MGSSFNEFSLSRLQLNLVDPDGSTQDQKIFDEEVSVLGNFLKNKTAEETDIILSGDFNSFRRKSDTANVEKNWDVRINRFQKLTPLLNKHDLHDMAEVNKNFEHTHFDKNNGSSSRIDFVFTNCLTV